MGKQIRDQRFLGTLDEPPDGLRRMGKAMGSDGCDMWTNGESIFSPGFRWALVRREESEK